MTLFRHTASGRRLCRSTIAEVRKAKASVTDARDRVMRDEAPRCFWVEELTFRARFLGLVQGQLLQALRREVSL
ncbi:MAG TPA: hypothetical protein VGK73_08865 [Polyangiaceae bacterium]